MNYDKMSFEQRCPVVLLCCGAFNPITVGHVKMFEIARNFLERTGNHIVISGIVSPVHDNFGKTGLISSIHRIAMCKSALRKYSWLSVDTWESSQNDWVKILKVLQHISNKIKNDYGVSTSPYSSPIYYSSTPCPRNTVTLQPDGKSKNRLKNRINGDSQNPNVSSNSASNYQNNNVELNEASEPDHKGVVFGRFSNNFKKVCCVRPAPLALSDNMIYGAAYDLRRTKVMLLCGSDLLESFGVPGLWSDDDLDALRSALNSSSLYLWKKEIQHVLAKTGHWGFQNKLINSSMKIISKGHLKPFFNEPSQLGLIPFIDMESSESDDGKLMRNALDRLQKVLHRVKGTVVLVNDQSRKEISDVSSTKCRTALKLGKLDNVRHFLNPDVLLYARNHSLYADDENQLC